jgi:aminoglycoside/choline kinase family phosphotransferase
VATEPSPDLGADAATAVRAVLGVDVRVTAAEPLGDGVGLLSSIVRLHLADGRRVIVKAPARDPRARAIASRFGYYAREAGTYESLLPRPAVRAPRCHGVLDGPDGPTLVLDDLGDLRSGDQLAGASERDAFAAADLLAALHASFWNDPLLAACSWLPGPTDPVIAGYGTLFELTWDAFRDRVHAAVPGDHLAAAERAIAHFDTAIARFTDAPRTLLHGDFRADNLLFDDRGDGSPEAWAIDWQLAAWGRGAYDLALFCAGSLETDVRRRIEADLIAAYHRALVTHGVTAYSLEDCRRDYRLGHVLNLPNPVTALVAVPAATDRGRRMLEANARRALAAVADHEPLLVPADA